MSKVAVIIASPQTSDPRVPRRRSSRSLMLAHARRLDPASDEVAVRGLEVVDGERDRRCREVEAVRVLLHQLDRHELERERLIGEPDLCQTVSSPRRFSTSICSTQNLRQVSKSFTYSTTYPTFTATSRNAALLGASAGSHFVYGTVSASEQSITTASGSTPPLHPPDAGRSWRRRRQETSWACPNRQGNDLLAAGLMMGKRGQTRSP